MIGLYDTSNEGLLIDRFGYRLNLIASMVEIVLDTDTHFACFVASYALLRFAWNISFSFGIYLDYDNHSN